VRNEENMITIQSPKTVEAAIGRIGELSGILAAGPWERAALIHAVTHDPEVSVNQFAARRLSSVGKQSSSQLAETFKRLGVRGLTSQESISRHRRNWQQALDTGIAQPFSLGEPIVIQEVDYPESRVRADGSPIESVRDLLYEDTPPEKQFEAVQRVMERNPEVAKRVEDAFVQKAGRNPSLHNRVRTTYEEFHPIPIQPERPSSLFNTTGFGAFVYGAVERLRPNLDSLVQALAAQRGGEHTAEMARDVIDTLEKTKRLIEEYEDAIRTAAGISYDETFERLMGRRG
jgi:hypothetical protein